MSARIGGLYASSGVSGVDPGSADNVEAVSGVVGQAHFGIRNIKTLVEAGGMTLEDVGHMTILVQDYTDLPVIDKEWTEMFPDPNNRPARQVMKMGVQRSSRVQLHMIAAV
jgi:2-iminobutanoate/2-iminopropanoate deaminase